ncbi:tetraspanin-9-like [Diabrotica undecimpunctata]|uniref:tetraspanin-9-like n=1 Tax=Diabrotica undecimpunctata TaxID=50387 RepID=UPI003B63E2FC
MFTCCIKYLLCAFNFIIFLSGTAILGVGLWLKIDKNSFIGLLKIVPYEQVQDFTKPGVIEHLSYLLMGIGGIMFIVSFLGYCGAMRESQCMLTTYGLLLLVILILEITAGCLAIIYKGTAETEVKNVLKTSLSKYYSNSENGSAANLAWDGLQMSLKCCGVDDYADYQKNENWAKGDKVIPESCCVLNENKKPKVSTCTYSPNEVNSYYSKGCYKEVINWIMSNLNMVIIVLVVFGVVEILGVLLSFCLVNFINKSNRFNY